MIKKNLSLCGSCIFFITFPLIAQIIQSEVLLERNNGVTYTFSGGRFGDNLISYYHAKWFSYKHKVPLFYVPFQFSDQLMLHEREMHLAQVPHNHFKKIVTINQYDPDIEIESDTLYVIPFFPEADIDRFDNEWQGFKNFIVDWDANEFKSELKRNVALRQSLQLLTLPSGILTVAVHVRKNGNGYDIPLWYTMPQFASVQGYINPGYGPPAKFLPDRFYVEQIKKLSEMLAHSPLYVFIFTDDKNPVHIMNSLKQQVNLPNLQFDCRRGLHHHAIHVLEDFFSMAQFDFLIRSESYFSLACSKIADFKIEITLDPNLENTIQRFISRCLFR